MKRILSTYHGYEPVVYAIFCRNDKFYVGETTNLKSRMIYGHFGIYQNRQDFIKSNGPLDLMFVMSPGISVMDTSLVHRIEDYVTVLLSKKYGSGNVYGGFSHLKSSTDRSKFVLAYDYEKNQKVVDLVDSKLDFDLPEIDDLHEAMFLYYGNLNSITEFELLERQYQLRNT